MKIHTLLLLSAALLLFSLSSIAQSVKVKDDIIYADGSPYAKMVKSGGLLPLFSIHNLSDDDLVITAKYNTDSKLMVITDLQSGQQVTMQNTIGFGKVLAKDLVEYAVFRKGALDPKGMKKFMAAHGGLGGASVQSSAGVSDASDSKDRNRSAPIYLRGNELIQDNVTIGTYTMNTSYIDGQTVKVMAVYTHNKKKIAEVTMHGVNPKSGRMVLLASHEVKELSFSSPLEPDIVKVVAAYLVERYFL